MSDESVIEVSDDDLERAIALSLADVEPDPADAPAPSGLAAIMNRKDMEAQRLARIVKRGRPVTPPSPRKASRLQQSSIDLPSGARLNMIVQHDQAARKSPAANAASANLKAEQSTTRGVKVPVSDTLPARKTLPPGEVIYPHGVVKKTWAFGHERTGDEIKLEEVLEASTLQTAVLSAFQWDAEWVLSKLKTPPNGGTTKCVFIMQGKEQALRKEILDQTEDLGHFLRICFPPMTGQTHCMHSKLQLLFHTKKLRIAIPTANLLNFDWGETGLMENSVWLIDLPRLSQGSAADLPAFAEDLIFFLKAQGVDNMVVDGLAKFDFSATANIAFVHSVGGISVGPEGGRTGLPGLSRAVRGLNLQATDQLELDFAASSIGSLKDDFLYSVHIAAKGDDLFKPRQPVPAAIKGDFFKPPSERKVTPKEKSIRDKIRVYFPTHDTVRTSTATAAGTICLSREWYENMLFPRVIFRDYVSTRTGLLSHNKILYARGYQRDEEGKFLGNVAWVYVGSSNMSQSAWGNITEDKKLKQYKVNCRNWECGVLLPAVTPSPQKARIQKGGEDSETESEDEESFTEPRALVSMDVFDSIVKPPFQYPGAEYCGREPWYFKEYASTG